MNKKVTISLIIILFVFSGLVLVYFYNKNYVDEPGVIDAYHVLRGMYVQYDTFKESIAPKIEKKLKEYCSKYDHTIITDDFTISKLFEIITDNLKNNATAMNNIAKLQPLESIHLSKDGLTKVRHIIHNIEIIINGK